MCRVQKFDKKFNCGFNIVPVNDGYGAVAVPCGNREAGGVSIATESLHTAGIGAAPYENFHLVIDFLCFSYVTDEINERR